MLILRFIIETQYYNGSSKQRLLYVIIIVLKYAVFFNSFQSII